MRKDKPKGIAGKNHRVGVVKFDETKKEKYLELLRGGGRRHASARAVGVTPQTVIHHRNADPDFADEISLAETEADDEVEDALRTAALSGNVTAALAWLYSRQPDRWRDERNMNINFRKMNDDQLRAYIIERLSAIGFSLDGATAPRLESSTEDDNDSG